MGFNLGKYSFNGPVSSIGKIRNRSGLYAIVCEEDREYFLMDIGESSSLRTRIENNDKKKCWIKKCNGQLLIFIRYTPFLKQQGRKRVKDEIKKVFTPACKLDENIWFSEDMI
jgi:hypothetical protein